MPSECLAVLQLHFSFLCNMQAQRLPGACRHEEARMYIDSIVRERLHVMVRGGILPNEMVRPTSVFYTNFVAEGLVRLAALADLEGADLWRFREQEGNSVLVRALPLPVRPAPASLPARALQFASCLAVLHCCCNCLWVGALRAPTVGVLTSRIASKG
jgi:hypothetical protein